MTVRMASLLLPLLLLGTAAEATPETPAAVGPDLGRSAISREPLFAGIIAEAEDLQRQTEMFGTAPTPALLRERSFADYAARIRALSDRDMQGHLDLKARGTDRDLKCIMMGVSLDLPNKLKDIETATTSDDLTAAFAHMADLLSDNIDVIVTPASAESGLDCTLEFGNR